VRHDYFESIAEPARAYVAGLLAADGSILERQRRVTLELAQRDRELVHFVRNDAYSRWGLTGTEAFLSAAMQLISDEVGVSRRRIRRHREQNVYNLHVNGADAFVVDEWLHSGTSLGLPRKRLELVAQTDSAASSSSLL
jgi:hypothetical protein